MTEYRIRTDSRIGGTLLAIVFGVMGLFLLARGSSGVPRREATVLLTGGVFVVAMAVITALHVFLARLMLDEHSVTLRGVFGTRSLLVGDIAGYRLRGYEYTHLISRNGGRGLKISDSYQRQDDIARWIRERFEDLDVAGQQQDEKAIMADDHFGRTEDERRVRLERAKTFALGGSFLGVILLLWELLYPYAFLMIAALVMPWAVVYALWRSRGLIRLRVGRGSGYPSLLFPLLLPVATVLVAALRDYKIYAFPSKGWVMLAAMTVLTAALFLIVCARSVRPERRRALIVGLTVLTAAIYSYGSIVFINCYYDGNAPEQMRVRVVSKRVAHEKYRDSYYLGLSAWGKLSEDNDVNVSGLMYDAVHKGDSVTVNLQPGKFGIPWYWVNYAGVHSTRY